MGDAVTGVELDLPFGDEGRMLAVMREMSEEMTPRRFALWDVAPEWADAKLVGWGYSDGEDVLLHLPDEYHTMELGQLPCLLRRMRLAPIWVDPEPTAAEPTAANPGE